MPRWSIYSPRSIPVTTAARAPCTPTARPRCLPGSRRLPRSAGSTALALHSQLAAAVQVLVHVSRDRAGRRRLSEIAVLSAGDDGRVQCCHRVAHRQRIRLRRRAFAEPAARAAAGVSGAALALALALLVAPATSRHRVRAHRPAAQLPPRQSPGCAWAKVLPCVVTLALVAAILAPPGVVAAVAILGATLEIRRRRRLRLRHRTAEATALQGALDVLVGELRVGAHPVAAFGVAADEVDGVVAAALRTIAARARLGADVADGMRSVARQSSLPDALGATRGVLAACAVARPGDRHIDADGAAGHR